jgi:hypothetical protein
MKQTFAWKKRAAALAAAALLAGPGSAEAPSTAVSEEAVVDTRTLCAAVLAEEAGLDSRSFTVDLSDAIRLNTKKVVGMSLLVK